VEPVCSEIKINISLYQKYSGDQDIKTNLNKLNSKERDSAATQVLIICKEQNVWLLLLILICVSVQWLDSDELITQGKNQSDSNCSCVTQAVS
jgi:carotenoid cleavage dioxygenase-like enzyme